jgi:hypothetical protein
MADLKSIIHSDPDIHSGDPVFVGTRVRCARCCSRRAAESIAPIRVVPRITGSQPRVFLRRLNHSAHHRGQLTTYLRLLGRPVYSTYGPTADTGGLFLQHAPTIYRYASIEDLLDAEELGGNWPPLPGPGNEPFTERP